MGHQLAEGRVPAQELEEVSVPSRRKTCQFELFARSLLDLLSKHVVPRAEVADVPLEPLQQARLVDSAAASK